MFASLYPLPLSFHTWSTAIDKVTLSWPAKIFSTEKYDTKQISHNCKMSFLPFHHTLQYYGSMSFQSARMNLTAVQIHKLLLMKAAAKNNSNCIFSATSNTCVYKTYQKNSPTNVFNNMHMWTISFFKASICCDMRVVQHRWLN